MAIDVKHIIVDTMFELSREKPLAKVSILDISNRSGISRQTFYNYFKDKNDLIRWIFISTLDRWDLVEKEGYYFYLRDLYCKAQENSQFLRQACMLSGQNSLGEEIQGITYRYHRHHILTQITEDHLTDGIEYALRFNAYGSTNCYIRWLVDKTPIPPEAVAIYAYESMPKSIRPYFK